VTRLNIKHKKLIIFYRQEIEKKGFLNTMRDINSFCNLKKTIIKQNPLRSFHCLKNQNPRNNISDTNRFKASIFLLIQRDPEEENQN
jgi:hypothetical protein